MLPGSIAFSSWHQPLIVELMFGNLTRLALAYGLRKPTGQHGTADLDDLMSGYARLDAYPECLAMLQALKARGFVTAILSNGRAASSCVRHARRSTGVRQSVMRPYQFPA